MKNEKALEILSDLTVDYENRTPDEIAELDEALDMAINSLKCIASAPLHFSNKDYELGYTTGYKKGYKDAYSENQLSQNGTNDEDRTEDDQISRRDAVDTVEWGITYARAINTSTGETKELFRVSNYALKEAAERIKKLPPAQPQRTGQWIYGEDDGQDGWYCSECEGFVPWDYEYYGLDGIDFIEDYKACPFCDAKMISHTGARMERE